MPISVAEFTKHLEASGLIDAAAVAEFAANLSGGGPPVGSEQLARELVRQKKLTRYQVERIYSGQGDSLVLGNYVILDKLGEGGMGMVLKAEHKRMKRLVALKVISAAALKTPDALKRFHREVEAAAKLRHPHIVAADDADEARGTHFLVMEYVEGSDLSALVRKQGALPVDKAVACILQAARGLEYAHQEGVIHRDIKPGNLLLDSKGTVKILDMGLARIEGEAGHQAELTSSGAVMGTVDYMAPEQALSTKTADARSDIYSLGISLWYLLTGRCAYNGDSLMAKLLAHRDQPVPSLRAARPEVPAAVEAVFRRMVAKRAADRYQSMTEVIRELEACLSGSSLSVEVNIPQTSDDALLSAFLNNLNKSTVVATAVSGTPFSQIPPGMTDSANSATMVASDVRDSADVQAISTIGSMADRLPVSRHQPGRSRSAASAWSKNKSFILGAGAVLLLIGLIWSQLPAGRDSTPQLSRESGEKPQPKIAVPPGRPKESAEKKALDWLFSIGATVGVGLPGAIEVVHGTAEALASGKPVVVVALNQKAISADDLAHLPALRSIHNLSLASCDIGDQELLPIGELTQLGILNLDHTNVTNRCLPILIECRSLQVLRLGNTTVTADGLETISKLRDLTDLGIHGLPVTRQSLSQLQKLRLLKNLDLGECPTLTDDFGALLAQFSLVERLSLDRTQFGDRGLLDLSKSPGLRDLKLDGCTLLTDQCGEILGQFPRLQVLHLAATPITDPALEGIMKSKTLQNLTLTSTRVTDAASPLLSQSQTLTWLDIRDTDFTAQGVRQLAAAMPWCHIESSHGAFAPTEPEGATAVERTD